MVITFEWAGQKYQIEKLILREARAYAAIRRELSLVPNDGLAENEERQIELAIQMFQALHCPEPILEGLTLDQMQDLWAALVAVHFGKPEAGEERPSEAVDGDVETTSSTPSTASSES